MKAEGTGQPTAPVGADWPLMGVLASVTVGQTLGGLFLVTVMPAIYRQNGLALEDFWLFALASTAKDDSRFGVVGRVALTPLLLLSGTFFPFENLPGVLRAVGVLTPVWHGVELCRAASAGVFPPGATLLHVGVLLAYLVAGWLLARRQFTRRLVA